MKLHDILLLMEKILDCILDIRIFGLHYYYFFIIELLYNFIMMKLFALY